MARTFLWPYIIVSFTFFLGVCFLYLSAGSIPEVNCGQDVAYLYDWAWRINNGQITHHDFHTIYGSLFGNLCALFLRLSDYDAIAFSWMNVAVTGVCFLLLGLVFLGADAAEPLRRKILTILTYAVLLAFGFGSTHLGIDTITHSALYNRYCLEILLVLFMACFLPGGGRRYALVSGIIAGACVAALILLKMVCFYIGVLWVVLGFIQRRNFTALLTTIASFLLLLGGYFFFTGINFFEMRADYRVPEQLRAGMIFLQENLKDKLWKMRYLPIAIADGILLIVFLFKRLYGSFILAVAVICCALLLHLTSNSNAHAEIPLLVFLPVLAMMRLPLKGVVSVLTIVLVCGYAGYFIGRSAVRFEQALILAEHKQGIPEINTGHIRHLYIESGRYGEVYVDRVYQAVNLIKKNVREPERIMAFDFDNPFNAIFDCPSPLHTLLVWEEGYSYGPQNPPPYETTFSDIDLLLIPREDKTYMLWKDYHGKLEHDFVQIAQSERWTLMQRRGKRQIPG